jgi:transposase
MMGRRRFAQKLYYQLSLDQLVPQDHLLRRIAEAVDFSFVRPLCRPFYSHTGQPSVDPIVLFKMLLVGYLYGITSERRLAQEVELHLAYRWFLGYDLDEPTPNHSVLSKARARFAPEVFEGFFRQSIALCQEAGLLAEGPVYVDSTLIQAAASMASLRQSGELAQPPLSVPEYVRRLYQENSREEPPVSQPEPPLPDQPLSPPSGESHPDRRQRRANNELQSRTDPEASVISRRGFGLHLAYKAHVAVAGQSGRVITAAIATTGATADEHLLGEVLWEHRRLSGLPVSEVVADGKYGTVANYVYLRKAGISAFIPPRRHGYQANGVWGRDHFRWLSEEDSFLCPAGQRLRRFTTVTTTRRIGYRAPKGSCAGCRFRSQCAPSGRQRTVSRFWDQDTVEEALELTSTPLGRQRLRERKVRAEGVFGLAKELHGLRRTRFKGRWKVQIQLWLTAAAMNMKRAVATMSRGTPAAAGAVAALPAVIRWIRRLLGQSATSATAPVHS